MLERAEGKPKAKDTKPIWARHVLDSLTGESRDTLKKIGTEVLGIDDVSAHGHANAADTWRLAIAELIRPLTAAPSSVAPSLAAPTIAEPAQQTAAQPTAAPPTPNAHRHAGVTRDKLVQAAGMLERAEGKPKAKDTKPIWARHVLDCLEAQSHGTLMAIGLKLGVDVPSGHARAEEWRLAIAKLIEPFAPSPSDSAQPTSPPTISSKPAHQTSAPTTPESSAPRQPSSASSTLSSASTVLATGGESGGGGAVGVALLIGASQDPRTLKGVNPADLKDIEFRSRFVPRKASMLAAAAAVAAGATRGLNALPDVMSDVATVKRFFDSREGRLEGMRVHTSFVGKDASGALTRLAFRNKLERLLDTDGQRVFVLYFAGHGSGDPEHPGALHVEDGVITFGDLLACWEAKKRLRSQYFVVIADSCHSGALVDQLKALPKDRREGLNMAVQAACRADELSTGGVFTETFTRKQLEPPGKFEWAKIYEQMTTHCRSCGTFFNQACGECRYMHREMGYPLSKEELQHPTFYCTWTREGTAEVPVPAAGLRFFKRA
jgi:hypothetical protein